MGFFSILAAATLPATAQDTQISARAKGMGGSYTAFGDDPIAIWQNPAGTATQTSKLALSYQSYITYEFANAMIGGDPLNLPGTSQATLNDPQIQPSFLGLVVSLSDKELNHAFSFGFINPLNLTLVWTEEPGDTILESRQQSARFRFGYAVDITLVKSGKGWLTHIAVGGGIDWGSTTYQDRSPDLASVADRESRFGFGVGILATVFSNGEGLSIDIGASYNSKLDFQGNVPRTGGTSRPFIDWPTEWSAGIAVYVERLKVTAAVQGVRWKDAAAASTVLGRSSLEDTLTPSAGVEYALHLTDKVTAFVRAGVRRFDAPWDDQTLTAFGGDVALNVAVDRWALSIDTDDEVFAMGTVGAGIYWTEEGGKKRGFDFGIEFGGDKVTVAIGYVHEF